MQIFILWLNSIITNTSSNKGCIFTLVSTNWTQNAHQWVLYLQGQSFSLWEQILSVRMESLMGPRLPAPLAGIENKKWKIIRESLVLTDVIFSAKRKKESLIFFIHFCLVLAFFYTWREKSKDFSVCSPLAVDFYSLVTKIEIFHKKFFALILLLLLQNFILISQNFH